MKEWMLYAMYATEFLRMLKIFLLVETKTRLGRKNSRTIADLIFYDCMTYWQDLRNDTNDKKKTTKILS